MQKIHLVNEGQRIDGTLFIPDNNQKNPGVIFMHGLTSSEDKYIPIAKELMEQGITSMTVNMRGHGTSEGNIDSLTMLDNIRDAFLVYDFFIKQNGIDADRIGILGSSYGCVLASIVSEKRQVKSLVLRAPAAYTDEMMKMEFGLLLKKEKKVFHTLPYIKDTKIIKAISKFKGDLLIIASENDNIVPFSIPETIFNEASQAREKKLKIIKNATHRLSEIQLKEFTSLAIEWFKKTL
jgi:hypothetical protein